MVSIFSGRSSHRSKASPIVAVSVLAVEEDVCRTGIESACLIVVVRFGVWLCAKVSNFQLHFAKTSAEDSPSISLVETSSTTALFFSTTNTQDVVTRRWSWSEPWYAPCSRFRIHCYVKRLERHRPTFDLQEPFNHPNPAKRLPRQQQADPQTTQQHSSPFSPLS